MNRNRITQKANPAGKLLKLQTDKIQCEHTANRVEWAAILPKGSHSATQTELKLLYTNIR